MIIKSPTSSRTEKQAAGASHTCRVQRKESWESKNTRMGTAADTAGIFSPASLRLAECVGAAPWQRQRSRLREETGKAGRICDRERLAILDFADMNPGAKVPCRLGKFEDGTQILTAQAN
jgi:hypothetical protein